MNVSATLFSFFAIIGAATALSQGTQNANKAPTVITFCAPQSNVYPFFMGEEGRLTGINPDLIKQMFQPGALPNVQLEYVKKPWKRCNADLESGAVDMMIGGYEPGRENVVYPSKLGFTLEESVISTAEVCFFSIPGEQMARAKRGMQGNAPFVVGIEAGFSKRHDDKIQPQWVELFNPIEKYRMLEKGRVDAIVQVCAMDGQYPIETKAQSIGFTNFEILYPPYLSNPAYVIFSEQFAQRHPQLSRRIVTASKHIDKSEIYLRYRPKDIH